MFGISRTCWWAGAERVALTFWVGGLWIAGYVVAPSLFASMEDRQLAGRMAGQIFQLVSYIGLAVGAGLLLSLIIQEGGRWLRDSRARIVLLMLVLVALGVGVLVPMMHELKLVGIAPGSEQAAQFARLHGAASILHLINSLLGLWLVATGFRGAVKEKK
ncbi:MAG TPA: DUF4149 domain-containing protein [Gammaproteobacteria bacterium]|nr:DUF4149 domain-containing protein [Gammaproteobacteria bacterium]